MSGIPRVSAIFHYISQLMTLRLPDVSSGVLFPNSPFCCLRALSFVFASCFLQILLSSGELLPFVSRAFSRATLLLCFPFLIFYLLEVPWASLFIGNASNQHREHMHYSWICLSKSHGQEFRTYAFQDSIEIFIRTIEQITWLGNLVEDATYKPEAAKYPLFVYQSEF